LLIYKLLYPPIAVFYHPQPLYAPTTITIIRSVIITKHGTTIPVTEKTKALLRQKRLKASQKLGRELTWDEYLRMQAR